MTGCRKRGLAVVACLACGLVISFLARATALEEPEARRGLSLPDQLMFGSVSNTPESAHLALQIPAAFIGPLDLYSIGSLGDFPWTLETTSTVAPGMPAGFDLMMPGSTRFYFAADAGVDSDGDGIPDAREKLLHGTDPLNPDTDDDGLPDGWELLYHLDLLDAGGDNGANGDPDGDQASNLIEYQAGVDPWNADSDDDGLDDGEEILLYETNPMISDSDGDGMDDGIEVNSGGDPLDGVLDPFAWVAAHRMPPVTATMDAGCPFYFGTSAPSDQTVSLNGAEYALPRDQIPIQEMGHTSSTETYITLRQVEPGLLEITFDGHGLVDGSPVMLSGSMTLNNGHFIGAPAQISNDTTEGTVTNSSPTTIEWTISCQPYPNYPPDAPNRGWTVWRVKYEPDLVRIGLVPDYNHDKQITNEDQILLLSKGPFRFWINDDDDSGDIADGDSDLPGHWDWGISPADYSNSRVDGRCDLLDFFPVWLDLHGALNVLPPSSTVQYKLRHSTGALKAVYTDLTNAEAGAFLITEGNTYGSSFSQNSYEADTFRVTPSGVVLDPAFLDKIKNDATKGILMVEGVAATTSPLVLEVWEDGKKVCQKAMPLSVDGVEKMYRWINLRHVTGGTESRSTDTKEPSNYPDRLCNGKQFVFVHGFSASETGARGWNAEVFKRMHQAGSRAMYTAVTWEGNETPGILPPGAYYHADVINAFQVASSMASQVESLPGKKYVAAHSLGNMVVSSAIVDHGLNPNSYFMINAAVAMEAYKASERHLTDMVVPPWQNYTNCVWASDWHELFDAPDGRRNLTWRGRFGNIPRAINYYSSGEDVLNNNKDGGSISVFGAPEKVWIFQERIKGGLLPVILIGVDSHGGWEFNLEYYDNVGIDSNGNKITRPKSSEDAALLTRSQLQTKSFFKPFCIADLFGSNGSVVASNAEIRGKVLAEAIPATSRATGRNPVSLTFNENVDLMSKLTKWPEELKSDEFPSGRWRHCDFKDVAYPYCYSFFDHVVLKGELQ